MKSNASSRRLAEVRPLGPEDSIDGPLFAINWIDTRWPLLYSIYMGLAGRLVRKIGGVPVFKGHPQETLAGPDSGARDLLLIVRYPSASSFLQLVHRRTFQVVSILRIAAVQSFSFVFHRRLDADPMSAIERAVPEDSGVYGALLYSSSDSPSSERTKLEGAAHRHGVRLHYLGVPTATLSLSRAESSAREIPYVTDRVALVSADSIERLQAFAAAEVHGSPHAFNNAWMGRMERSL